MNEEATRYELKLNDERCTNLVLASGEEKNLPAEVVERLKMGEMAVQSVAGDYANGLLPVSILIDDFFYKVKVEVAPESIDAVVQHLGQLKSQGNNPTK